MRVWHWCQTQQELTWTAWVKLGWIFYWMIQVLVELISQMLLRETYSISASLLEYIKLKSIYQGSWGLDSWHMRAVGFCWGLDTNVPGSSQVSVRFQSQVKRQPKHDSSDSLTCCLQSLKSSVCPASILSPISVWPLWPSLSQHSINVQSASVPLADPHHMGVLSARPAPLTLIVKLCKDLTSVSQHRY